MSKKIPPEERDKYMSLLEIYNELKENETKNILINLLIFGVIYIIFPFVIITYIWASVSWNSLPFWLIINVIALLLFLIYIVINRKRVFTRDEEPSYRKMERIREAIELKLQLLGIPSDSYCINQDSPLHDELRELFIVVFHLTDMALPPLRSQSTQVYSSKDSNENDDPH